MRIKLIFVLSVVTALAIYLYFNYSLDQKILPISNTNATQPLLITSNLQPLPSSLLETVVPSFKKTTPQEASQGFNYNTHEYYDVTNSKSPSSKENYIFYKIYSKDRGIKKVSEASLTGENFNIENCGIFSFLETSNTFFVVCRDNNVNKNTSGNYAILGFATVKDGASDFENRTMSLVLKDSITVNRGNHVPFFDISITQVSAHHYYLTTSDGVYFINPDPSGTFLKIEKLDLIYFKADSINDGPQALPNVGNGWALKLIYNQLGNLIIFTDNEGGGVIDALDNQSLVLDSSCYTTISPESKLENRFYNSTVDPFIEGPYKSISEVTGVRNTFQQTVENAGCAYREGRIKLYRQGNQVYCATEVKNELIGC